MQPIEKVLALWQMGRISSEQVVKWADGEIERLDRPSVELMDLATDGPLACLKRPGYQFRACPAEFAYRLEFSLLAMEVALSSRDSIWEFAQWVSRRCIGENLQDPMVLFAYQLDDYWEHFGGEEAVINFARTELPAFLPECQALVNRFAEDLNLDLP